MTVTYKGTKLQEGTDYTVSWKKAGTAVSEIKNGGKYSVTVSGTGNCYGEASKSFSIAPAEISASVSNNHKFSKVYDGAVSVSDANNELFVLNGIYMSDDVRLNTSGAQWSYDTKDIGTKKTITISGMVLEGEDASNYKLADDPITVKDAVIVPDLSAISGLTTENVTVSDAAACAKLKEILETADEATRKANGWEDAYQTCLALMEQITKISSASVTDAISSTSSITGDNVTLEHKTDLVQAKADLEAALVQFDSNLTAADKASLQELQRLLMMRLRSMRNR